MSLNDNGLLYHSGFKWLFWFLQTGFHGFFCVVFFLKKNLKRLPQYFSLNCAQFGLSALDRSHEDPNAWPVLNPTDSVCTCICVSACECMYMRVFVLIEKPQLKDSQVKHGLNSSAIADFMHRRLWNALVTLFNYGNKEDSKYTKPAWLAFL